ncbi:MAG: heavy-metal-associated domain-containing protein [Flavobacteriales bacterium]
MKMHAITLPILDMNSPQCATRVEKAITSVPTLTASSVDLSAHTATLSGDPSAQAVRDAITAIRAAGYDVATEKHSFTTTGITCGGCVGSVTNILSALPGVLTVTADVPLKQATVESVQGTVTDDELRDALKPAGYEFIAQAA